MVLSIKLILLLVAILFALLSLFCEDLFYLIYDGLGTILFNRIQMKILPTQEVKWLERENVSSSSNFNTTGLPNVLLILADDLGYNDVGKPYTKNIDSIRYNENGISFSNAYSGQATCSPSRAALYTGR